MHLLNHPHFFDPDTTWCVLIQRNITNVGEDTREKPMIPNAQRPAECATQDSQTAGGLSLIERYPYVTTKSKMRWSIQIQLILALHS